MDPGSLNTNPDPGFLVTLGPDSGADLSFTQLKKITVGKFNKILIRECRSISSDCK